MHVLRQVRSRARGAATQLRGLRPSRPWHITVGDIDATAGRSRVATSWALGWWAYRTRWPLPEAPTDRIPVRTPVVHIETMSWEGLRDLAADALATRKVRVVHLRVGRWRAPIAGWSGQLGQLPGLVHADVRLPSEDVGSVTISVTLQRQRSLREVIVAALDVVSPRGPLPTPLSASVATHGAVPTWFWPGHELSAYLRDPATQQGSTTGSGKRPVGKAGVQRADGLPPASLPAVDVEFVLPGARPVRFGEVPTAVAQVSRTGIEGQEPTRVLLDLRGVAGGRWQAPDAEDARGRLVVRSDADGPHWALRSDGVPVPATPSMATPWQPLAVPVDAAVLTSLPRWWSMTTEGLDRISPPEAALLVARIAASGIIIDGTAIPDAVAAHLDSPLVEVLRSPLPGPSEDHLGWEIRSVRQRREVMRGHGTALRLPGLLRSDALRIGSPPTVTALLVTRRPHLAISALRMMAAQTYPALQVMVGLHGVEPTEDLMQVVAAMTIPTRIVPLPAAALLGEALAIATGRADGSLVTKVDDDDLYGPEHIWDLVLARATSGAMVVGKAAEFVALDLKGITVRRDNMASSAYDRVVAGGTILVPRGELEAIGGWRPVRSGVDRAFLDRVIRAGGLIYRTWPVGFIYRRHGEGHTWGPTDDYFLRSVRQRWDGRPPFDEFGIGDTPVPDSA